ncbi:MAG: hypothetical protein M0P64_04245 [Candidatus Pacebacteria bacterium]|jgi:hypothetical protein|nr:hypothetical protein [Candidatus Paceibacterota bacterium]
MSQKMVNRLVAAFIFFLFLGTAYWAARGSVSAFFEAGPFTLHGIIIAIAICIGCVFVFLMAEIFVRDIISGENHEYPGY